MKAIRTITTSVVLATMALAPAAALAKHGADDPAGQRDDRGGQRDNRGGQGDDRGGQRSGNAARSSRRAEKRVTGTCTGRSTAKIKAKPRDGRLEVEFEVDQNRNGVTWDVAISRNGTVAVTTTATTVAPSGSFSVERRVTNGAGSDTISARATSPTGEVCTASVTI